jgi:hypothetical protein
VVIDCDATCSEGKCVYDSSVCTECRDPTRKLSPMNSLELELFGSPVAPSHVAGTCICLEGYKEETDTAGANTGRCVLNNECYNKCATCFQFDDPQSCKTCKDEYILEEIGTGTTGGRCVLPSNIGNNYYIDDSDPNVPKLVQCDSRCNGCFGPSNYECEVCADATQSRWNNEGCQCPGC